MALALSAHLQGMGELLTQSSTTPPGPLLDPSPPADPVKAAADRGTALPPQVSDDQRLRATPRDTHQSRASMAAVDGAENTLIISRAWERWLRVEAQSDSCFFYKALLILGEQQVFTRGIHKKKTQQHPKTI